jgi:hypothetical protein
VTEDPTIDEPRLDRLLRKAEDAADTGEYEKAESYRSLADLTAYLDRKRVRTEAKALRAMTASLHAARRPGGGTPTPGRLPSSSKGLKSPPWQNTRPMERRWMGYRPRSKS